MTCTAAFMHIPSAALSACVLAGVERDTRGCTLDDAERFNYYPATPMITISWVFEGALHMVEECGQPPRPTLGPALPRLILSGPQRSPSVSWSPGAVHALSVGFYPEALGRLIAPPIDAYLNRHLPLEAVASPALLQTCQAILAVGDAQPFQALDSHFQPLWREPGPHSSLPPYLGNWVRSLSTRATHSTAGKSLRQLQRRIRHWTGQSHRDLQLFTRVEEAFLRRIEADESAPNLAAIAADAGFADQSHMGREIRRVTGMSPARFGERMAREEAFWYYRLIADELRRPSGRT